MGAPPNEVFSAFAFVGFLMCAIPFYWHLEAWNTGTCLFMFWAGIGCLLEFINSVVWNKNMVLRAPVYCDISSRFSVAQNVAIPAASLCINRRLYKIATMKTVTVTASEKRRAVMIDLLIGVGLPILQMIFQYIISFHRYTIFEDIGPAFSNALVIESVYLFYIWPLIIGCVSFFYCTTTIYTLMKREHQFSQIMSSNRRLNRSRYFRLMVLAAVDICCTIPLGSYVLHRFLGVHPKAWVSWSKTHNGNNYSHILQIPASVWRAIPYALFGLETTRWFIVFAAFAFFALFGFADEARQHYRLAFKSLATRVGISTTNFTLYGSSSHGTSSLPAMKNKGEVNISVTTRRNRRDSFASFADQLSIPSIAIPNDLKPDIKIDEYTPTGSMSSSSVEGLNVTLPVLPPTSVSPYHADSTEPTVPPYSGDAANAV